MLLLAHLSYLHENQLLAKLFFSKSNKLMQFFVGNDGSQPHLYLMCQPMPPVFMRIGILILGQVESYLDNTRPVVLKIFTTNRSKVQNQVLYNRQKEDNWPLQCCFFSHCGTGFEALGCFYHFCACHKIRPSLTEQDIHRASKKRELDELRRSYIKKKVFTVIEMWECEWWRLYKTTSDLKLHIRESFSDRRSLTEHQLLEGIRKGNFFGYVQCDIEVPEFLRANFADFPVQFKNTLVSKNDTSAWWKRMPKKKE